MPPSTRQILSRNVRLLRVLHGWSQEQLAERCGLHRTYIGAIERGERNLGLDNLERLARALHTTAAGMLQDRDAAGIRYQIREIAALYTVPPRKRRQYPPDACSEFAVYARQTATHSLSTAAADFPVMTVHESKCKEASGSTY